MEDLAGFNPVSHPVPERTDHGSITQPLESVQSNHASNRRWAENPRKTPKPRL
jgi:hypothetical protein